MTALAQIIAASLALVESRPDLHGKIIRGGNFSSRARSSPMEKREAIVPRDRVCYRSNRNRFLSLSLSLFSIFIFIHFLFFFLRSTLSLCIVRFPVSPTCEASSVPPSRFALFSASFFSYFCRSISRRQDFTDSWFHLIRLFRIPFLIPIVPSISRAALETDRITDRTRDGPWKIARNFCVSSKYFIYIYIYIPR